MSLEDYASLLIDQQVAAEVVKMLTGACSARSWTYNAYLSDGVQRALGRPPRDFSDYARATSPPASGPGEPPPAAQASSTRMVNRALKLSPGWTRGGGAGGQGGGGAGHRLRTANSAPGGANTWAWS